MLDRPGLKINIIQWFMGKFWTVGNHSKQVIGGEGGIRTHVTVTRKPHFECGAFDHSATSPQKVRQALGGAAFPVERRPLANEFTLAKRPIGYFSCVGAAGS